MMCARAELALSVAYRLNKMELRGWDTNVEMGRVQRGMPYNPGRDADCQEPFTREGVFYQLCSCCIIVTLILVPSAQSSLQ